MSGKRGSRPTLPQDVYRHFMWTKRLVREQGSVTAVQAEFATEVLAILFYRGLLSREQARLVSPAGLQSIARLVDPESVSIATVVGSGIVSQAGGLLRLRPPQTLERVG